MIESMPNTHGRYADRGPRANGSGHKPDDSRADVMAVIRKGAERPRWLGADEAAMAAVGRQQMRDDARSMESWYRQNAR